MSLVKMPLVYLIEVQMSLEESNRNQVETRIRVRETVENGDRESDNKLEWTLLPISPTQLHLELVSWIEDLKVIKVISKVSSNH